MEQQQWIGLIAVVVPVLVWASKQVLPYVPKGLIPWLTPLLGVGLDWLAAQAGAVEGSNAVRGALLGAVGTWVRELVDQMRKVGADKIVTKVGSILCLCLCMGWWVSGVGCKTRLEPGGAYAPAVVVTNVVMVTSPGGQLEQQVIVTTNALSAPDPAFFMVDQTFDTVAAGMDVVFKFERRNRALLWQISPDIKKSLDRLRVPVDEVIREYGLAREAYLKNPTPAGLSGMRLWLAKTQQVSVTVRSIGVTQTTAAAQAIMARPVVSPPLPGK